MSAGNHAQAVAFHAKNLNIPVKKAKIDAVIEAQSSSNVKKIITSLALHRHEKYSLAIMLRTIIGND